MAVAPAYVSALATPYHDPDSLKEAIWTGTVGAADTYVTGGFTIAPSSFGLSNFVAVYPVNFSTGHWGIWDSANAKIKVFSAAATELANASAALQSATFTITALGL